MRTTKRLLRTALVMCFVWMASAVSAQYSILSTGFEDGLPTDWVIENGVGTVQWTVDATSTGTELPATAYEGTTNMLFYVDGSSAQTTSRLITPKLDLTMFNQVGAGDPTLTFYYANTPRLLEKESFVDVLRVYGRENEAAEWVLLATIDTGHDVWTKTTVDLASYAHVTTYQICFEAANGNGRGMMIDEVKVISSSLCGKAPNIRISNKTENAAKVSWDATQNAIQSQLKISTTKLTDMSQTADLVDTIMDVRELQLSNLEADIDYYVYVRNLCTYEDYSPWAYAAFRPDKPISVPYTMDFEDYAGTVNNEYTMKTGVDTVNLPANWTFWKNTNFMQDFANAYQHYPFRGYGKTAAYNPSGEAKENRILNIKGYISTTYGTIESYAILPRMDVDSIQKLYLSFDYRTVTCSYAKLVIGVVEDPADEGSFVAVEEITSHKLGVISGQAWKKVTVSFANYKGTGKYIAIQQQPQKYNNKAGGSSMATYIDNIVVDYMPACMKANALRAVDVTGTTAVVTWAGNADAYDLKVASEPLRSMTQTADVFDGQVSALEKALTGLNPGTTYYFYVRPTCGSEWTDWNFNTLVEETDVVTVPYHQDFDTYGNGTYSPLPNGWGYCGSYTTPPYIHATRFYEGKGAIYVGGSATATSVAATPAFNLPMDQLQATFMSCAGKAGYQLVVGVIGDQKADSTFTPIDTIVYDSPYQWQEYIVDLSAYKGTGRHLAFRGGLLSAAEFYVDNLVVEKIPNCKKVESLDLVNVTSNSLQVAWTPRGKETAWTVCYGPAGFDRNNAGTTVSVTGKPNYTITGLDESTSYDIYVRAECGEGESGAWRVMTATTMFTPAEATGYTHDFSAEAENAKWVFENGTNVNQWVIGSKAKVEEGNPAAYPSNDPTNKTFAFTPTSGNKSVYFYRSFHFAKGDYTISYNWKGFGYSSSNFMRAFLVPVNVQLEANDFYSQSGADAKAGMPEGWHNLSVNVISGTTENFYLNQDSVWGNGWNQSGGDVVLLEEGYYNLVFVWCENSTSGTKCPVAIDNIAINTTTCPKPGNVVVNTDFFPGYKAEFTWIGGTKAEIKVMTNNYTSVSSRPSIATAAAVASGSDITDHHFVAEGLTPGKTYYYGIRTYDGENTSEWAVGSFVTGLGVETPYANDFEDTYTTLQSPWMRIGAANSAASTVAPTMEELFNGAAKGTGTSAGWGKTSGSNTSYKECENFTGNGFLRTASSNTKGSTGKGIRYYAYSPEMRVDKGYQLRYSVVYTNNDGGASKICQEDITSRLEVSDLFALLISTDRGRTWKKENAYVWTLDTLAYQGKGYKGVFNLVDIANVGEGIFHDQMFKMDDYEGDTIQIAFYVNSAREAANKATYCNLDNFYLGPQPCEQMKDVTVSDITANSAKISWTPGGSETAWRVHVSTYETTNYDDDSNVVLDTIVKNATSLVVDGLKAGHPYVYYTKSICDLTNEEEKSSAWSNAKTFTTECPKSYTLPYVETFENYSTSTAYQTMRTVFHPCYENAAHKEAYETYAYIYNANHTTNATRGACLCLYTPTQGNGWVSTKLPEMPVRVDSLKMTFYVKADTGHDEGALFEVGVELEGGFTSIKKVTPAMGGSWEKVEVTFDAYKGDTLVTINEEGELDTIVRFGKNIVLRSRYADGAGEFFIDDINIGLADGCAAPSTFTYKNTYYNIMTFNWSTREGEDQYQLKVLEEQVATSKVATAKALLDTVVSGSSFVWYNIPYDRTYYAYITPLCDENKKVWSNALEVHSLCPLSFSLPYKEDFNWWKENTASNCWEMLTNRGYDAPYATSSKDSYDGNYLYMSSNKNDNYGPQQVYTVLPKLNAQIDTTQISFMIYAMDANPKPEVGVMTSQQDTSSFVSIATIPEVLNRWINVVVPLDKYKGTGKYIAIRQYYGVQIMIDNVEVGPIGSVPPMYGDVTEVTENSIAFNWVTTTPAPAYEVLYYTGSKDSVIVRVEGKENTVLTGLKNKTNYHIYVRSIYEDKEPSSWVKIAERPTLAVPMQLPYEDDFSVAEQNEQWSTAHTAESERTNNWIFGTNPTGSDTCLYISNYGTMYNYAKDRAHTYVYRPVVFETGRQKLIVEWQSECSMSTASSSSSGPTSVYDYMTIHLIPAISNMDKVTTPNGDKLGTYRASANSSDFQNIVSPTTTTAQVLSISNRQMRDQSVWRRDTMSFMVPQAGTYHVAFYWNNYNSIRNGEEPAAVRYLKVEQDLCAAPEKITSYAFVSGTELELNWVNGKKWDLKVSSTPFTDENLKDANYKADVLDASVDKLPYIVGGLKGNTTYYVAVRTVCDGGYSGWTTTTATTLATPATLPFYEDFNDQSTLNKRWAAYEGFISDALAGVALTKVDNSSSWVRKETDCVWENPHANLTMASSAAGFVMDGTTPELNHTKHWIVSPTIAIPEGQTQLTFDVSLTLATSSLLSFSDACVDATESVADHKFGVLVSLDNGRTWEKENAIIWNDADGDYMYSALTAQGKTYLFDFGKYAGKVIRLAFAGETREGNNYRMLHVDNIRLSHTIPVAIKDTTCAGYAYRENGFDIPAASVQPQDTPYEYSRTVNNTLTADTLYTLSLMVGRATEQTIKAEICEGEVYEQFGFQVSTPGRHVNMMTSSMGCDSVIYLDLTVHPAYNFEENITICSSQLPYTWKNSVIEEAGKHTENYNTIMGCDSIYTLNLTVIDNYERTFDVQLCQGESYKLGSQVITESGTYAEVFQSVYGCDSTVTVNVTVNPTYTKTVELDLCAGTTFDVDGQTYTESGVYTAFYTTVNGCDSIVNYKLTFHEKMYTMLQDTIAEGEVYNKHGFENLTEEGVHQITLQATGGCDSIIVLTLVLDMADAIYNPQYTTLTLTPNPVKKGGVVTVQQDFNANRVKVEVFSPIGAKVREQYFDMREVKDIQLSGFAVSGTYLVRITTEEGDVYMAKLIVQ